MQIRVKEDPKEFGTCGCGRSPIGHCIGWHNLTEDEFRQRLAEWDAKMMDPKQNTVE